MRFATDARFFRNAATYTFAACLAGACSDGAHPRVNDGGSLPEGSDGAAVRQDADSTLGDDAAVGDAEDAGAGNALCTSCGSCEQVLPVTSARHVGGVVPYSDLPPVGGDHDACWKKFGVYTTEVPAERWVHNLEHGGVVFLHNCQEDCSDALADMAALAHDRPMALVTPYAALDAPFAVVAWGVRLVSDCYDSAAFQAFYAAHVNHAPESISAGPSLSACPP